MSVMRPREYLTSTVTAFWILYPEHIIAETGSIETTRGWDIDGDGIIEIVPNVPGGPLAVYKLKKDGGTGKNPFERHPREGHKTVWWLGQYP